MNETQYVLTIFNEGVLESCDIFMSLDDAFYSGQYYCKFLNIAEFDPNSNNYDLSMDGWIICDTFPYFISIVRRVSLTDRKTSFNPRNKFQNALRLSDRFAMPAGHYGIKFVKVELPDLPTEPPVPVDDAGDPTLPGGFSLGDRPLLLSDVAADPYYARDPYQLSENQKWGLVLARAKKRPNITHGVFSHAQIIDALSRRTDQGYLILAKDLNFLDNLYQGYRDAANSEEEESSSSSSEEYEDPTL